MRSLLVFSKFLNQAAKSLVLMLMTASYSSYGNNYDPTAPLNASGRYLSSTANSHKTLRLESIIRSNQQLSAVINGQVLVLGEHFGEYTLAKINKNSVVLTSTEQSITLPLFVNILGNDK